jgi:hypothetical protein
MGRLRRHDAMGMLLATGTRGRVTERRCAVTSQDLQHEETIQRQARARRETISVRAGFLP